MARRATTRGALVAVLVLLLAAGPAEAKRRPKPDRTPPVSTITTEDMAVKVGVDSSEPPEAIREHTLVEGTARDNKRGQIDYVVIRFTREDPVAGHLGEIEVDTCEPPRRTCLWTARVPWLDDDLIEADPVMGITHGVPAVWDVEVYAVDEAGNRERNGPAIQIVVI